MSYNKKEKLFTKEIGIRMQPTLFAIAKADLKTAKSLVGSTDKYQKHQAAYFTQQAIEKTIKYIVSKKNRKSAMGT